MPARGPKSISAAQQKFLGDRMARQPVKATKPAAVKPNPFSASTTPLQSASLTPGMSASGAGAIPTASAPGASSSPTSLGMTPTASAGGYRQGGSIKSFAAGGSYDSNASGSWAAGTGITPEQMTVNVPTNTTSLTNSPIGQNPGNSPTTASVNTSNPQAGSGYGGSYSAPTNTTSLTNSPVGQNPGSSPTTASVNTSNPQAGSGYGNNYSAPTNSPVGQNPGSSPITAGAHQPVSGYGGGYGGGYGNTGQVQWGNGGWGAVYFKGGSIERPYRNKWKSKNHPGDTSYKFEDGGSAPESDPDMARARQTTGRGAFKEAMKNDQATRKAFPTGQSTGQQQEADAQSIADYIRSGGQEGKGDTSSLDYDSGGGIPDPAIPLDAEQGQEGQAGDLGSALSAVQNAFQYGRQQLAGDIIPLPIQPGVQPPAGAQSGGVQGINTMMQGGQSPSLQNIAPPLNMGPQAYPPQWMGRRSTDETTPQPTVSGAAGMSVPPATPQPAQTTPPPAGGGVGGNPPPQIMRYLTGADAAPIPQVLQRMNSMRGPGGAAKAVASGRTPQEQYAIMQGLRKLSNAAGAHARASLQGNAQAPASLNHAVMFANKKFEYTPSGTHIQFSLKGKHNPAQKAARGGSIQSFDNGGGMQDPTQITPENSPDITALVQNMATGQSQTFSIGPTGLEQALQRPFDKTVKDGWPPTEWPNSAGMGAGAAAQPTPPVTSPASEVLKRFPSAVQSGNAPPQTNTADESGMGEQTSAAAPQSGAQQTFTPSANANAGPPPGGWPQGATPPTGPITPNVPSNVTAQTGQPFQGPRFVSQGPGLPLYDKANAGVPVNQTAGLDPEIVKQANAMFPKASEADKRRAYITAMMGNQASAEQELEKARIAGPETAQIKANVTGQHEQVQQARLQATEILRANQARRNDAMHPISDADAAAMDQQDKEAMSVIQGQMRGQSGKRMIGGMPIEPLPPRGQPLQVGHIYDNGSGQLGRFVGNNQIIPIAGQ